VYSLVSAPVLGFDLVRLGGGAATAEILLRSLRLTSADLAVVAAELPGDDVRGRLWLDVADAAHRLPSLRAATAPAQLLDIVTSAPIGNLDALLRLLRHDIMAWTWTGGPPTSQDPVAERATAVLCDAAAATYLGDVLAAPARRRLAGAWVAAMRRLPALAPVDLGPHHPAAGALLDLVGTARPADAGRLVRAADAGRADAAAWSTAVHSASWAAYLAGRVNTAATAQLLLVQAVDSGDIPRADRAGGVWNLLSGAMHALVVRDLLDAATAHRLLTPVVAALGAGWLTGWPRAER
jgi:hypothetical protein